MTYLQRDTINYCFFDRDRTLYHLSIKWTDTLRISTYKSICILYKNKYHSLRRQMYQAINITPSP